MKITLLALSVLGAAICITSAVALIRQGHGDTASISRIIGAGFAAMLTFSLARHPEWKRYLEEKF